MDTARIENARLRARYLMKIHGAIGAQTYCRAASEASPTKSAIEYWDFVSKTVQHLTTGDTDQ